MEYFIDLLIIPGKSFHTSLTEMYFTLLEVFAFLQLPVVFAVKIVLESIESTSWKVRKINKSVSGISV